MSFGDVITFLNQGWVSLIWGVVLTYIGYRLGRRRAAPRALITASRELTWGSLDALPQGIELKFKGRDIPRISRGLIRVWNGGSETLMGTTVAPTDPVRIEIEDGEFLLCQLLKASNPASRCEIQPTSADPKAFTITFDFLDPNDGMLVGFLHTATVAEPELRGTLRGHPFKVERGRTWAYGLDRVVLPFRDLKKRFPFIILAAGVLILSMSLLPESWIGKLRNSDVVAQQPNRPSRFFFASAGAAYIGIAGFLIWARRRKYPKSLEFPSPRRAIGKSKPTEHRNS